MIKLFVYKINDLSEGILDDKMSLLSSEEKEKVLRYKYDKDRLRSLIGRLMLFCFTDRYTDETYGEINYVSEDEFCESKISDIVLFYEEIGKARIKNRENIYFNISHSKDYVVLALSDKDVGVDIQEIKPLRNNIPGRFFHPKDVEYIGNDDKTYFERFTEVWCAKESYSKLTGKGISEGFSTFYENFETKSIIDAKTGVEKAVFKEYEIDEKYKLCSASYE